MELCRCFFFALRRVLFVTMTKNPIVNALTAAGYIALVASLMFYGPHIEGMGLGVFVPITFLSIFVFSAATMGFIFFYKPIELYFAGEKEKGVGLFLKTLLSFGIITAAILSVIFLTA